MLYRLFSVSFVSFSAAILATSSFFTIRITLTRSIGLSVAREYVLEMIAKIRSLNFSQSSLTPSNFFSIRRSLSSTQSTPAAFFSTIYWRLIFSISFFLRKTQRLSLRYTSANSLVSSSSSLSSSSLTSSCKFSQSAKIETTFYTLCLAMKVLSI